MSSPIIYQRHARLFRNECNHTVWILRKLDNLREFSRVPELAFENWLITDA